MNPWVGGDASGTTSPVNSPKLMTSLLKGFWESFTCVVISSFLRGKEGHALQQKEVSNGRS